MHPLRIQASHVLPEPVIRFTAFLRKFSTDDIIENHEKYAEIVSGRIPILNTKRTLELATSGKANKVIFVFDSPLNDAC